MDMPLLVRRAADLAYCRSPIFDDLVCDLERIMKLTVPYVSGGRRSTTRRCRGRVDIMRVKIGASEEDRSS